MNESLEKMVNTRLRLTRINQNQISSEEEEGEEESDSSDDENREMIVQPKVKKYNPPVRWKEHYLSHYEENIRNLAPLPLLTTDTFESVHAPFKSIGASKGLE